MDCNTGLFMPQLITGLMLGFLYALIALGYTMVYGVLKLINFAHDAVFMLGSVAVFYVFGLALGAEPVSGVTLAAMLLAVLIVGGIASALAAGGLELSAYRPLRRRGAARLSYLISAIGASFFATYLMQQSFNNDFFLGPARRTFPQVMASDTAFNVFDTNVLNIDVVLIVTAIVCFVLLDRLINQTRTGRSIRALSEDIVASQLMGVNVTRVIVTTFLIGGFFGGVAGVLNGMRFGFVEWDVGFLPGIKAFTAAVLGGIGNIRGAMLGGLALGVIENVSAVCIGSEWKNVVAFSVLVLVLILRPTGILGERIGG
ncbi:MAG TPA: branched-chain amino acid ABC transporter permease [Actinomycetota bacterium]|nr:branched-chain amino acid ABC transporter permease [Actinomycetota bacterium]